MTQPPWQQPNEQPQYGQPQYGQPQYGQPPYAEPQYGQPPYGGSGSYPPAKQGNGFAIAGIILAVFAPILGLIFSIIGLVKSGARAGAGKGLSIAGIVLSVVVGVGGTIVVVNALAHSTAADPGCIRAEGAARQMNSTISADGAAISRDAGNPSALRTDLQKFQTDMQSLQSQLSSAQGQARHQVVTTRIGTLNSDISTLSADLQALENGDVSQASQMDALATKLQHDGDALDSTCSTL